MGPDQNSFQRSKINAKSDHSSVKQSAKKGKKIECKKIMFIINIAKEL